jgi:hypothetical protein
MRLNHISAAVALGAWAVFSLPAQAADSATASVNAMAGLAPVLTLSCTDVNFGVWRVPVRSGGGVTTVTLTVDANNGAGTTTATAAGNTSSVSLSSEYLAPKAATCSVSGASVHTATIQTAIASNTGLTFGASTHESLATPGALAALSATLTLAGTGVVVDANGAGSFRITGTLSIPAAISASNYGGYKTQTGTGANAATVTLTDAI